jgi:hypothetical protein
MAAKPARIESQLIDNQLIDNPLAAPVHLPVRPLLFCASGFMQRMGWRPDESSPNAALNLLDDNRLG